MLSLNNLKSCSTLSIWGGGLSCLSQIAHSHNSIEWCDADNLKNFVQTWSQVHSPFHYCNKQVGAHCCPNLSSHRILRDSDKRMDTLTLLDTSEEQFDVPPRSVEMTDHLWRRTGVVGKEYQRPFRLFVAKSKSTWRFWIILAHLGTTKPDALIASQAGISIDKATVCHPKLEIRFRNDREKRAIQAKSIQASKACIAPVHYIDSSAFYSQRISHVHFVNRAVPHHQQRRYRSSKIHERMQLDRSLRPAKSSPRKQTQVKSNHRRMQEEHGLTRLYRNSFFCFWMHRRSHRRIYPVGECTPISSLARIRRSALGHLASGIYLMKKHWARFQCWHYIAKTVAVDQMSKGYGQPLIVEAEFASFCISGVCYPRIDGKFLEI